MPRIFSSRTSSLGAEEQLVRAAANAPVTIAQAQRGKAELAKMRRSLAEWLKFRALNDKAAAGAPPVGLLSPRQKRELTRPTSTSLAIARMNSEQALATQLYQLLSECFDSSSLPSPDLSKDRDAAAKLAQIAIAGQLPGTTTVPSAAAGVWMWPVVVIVGVIGFVIMTSIKSSADVAKEKEKIECIKAGACTDSGFFLKLGAAVFLGWFAWEKLGVGDKVKGAISKHT